LISLIDVRLVTERLLLLPIDLKHSQEIFTSFDNQVTRFMLVKPPAAKEGTEHYINQSREKMKQNEALVLMMLNKKLREFIGCISLHHLKEKTPAMGIWIRTAEQNKGYGMEAARSLIKYARGNLEFDHILYQVALENSASRRLVNGLGGKLVKNLEVNISEGNLQMRSEYWISS
jgi:ribosomal-protein-alanine N-acetyltransferase